MTRMKVSVALATYNGEKYLSEQLESLARQITLPDELVVADDGSGDHTCEIIEDFRMHAPFPVHVISGQHLGYVSNFFRAIAACRGEVIALCDQDDIWRPEKLSVCLPYFRQNVTLVMHSARVVDAWGNPLAKRAPIVAKTRELTRGIFQDGPLKSFPLGFSLLIHRSVTDKVLRALSSYPEILRHYFGHEMPLYWMAKARGDTIYLSRELAYYRRHESNVSPGRALANQGVGKAWHNNGSTYREFGQHAQYQAELLSLLSGLDSQTDAILQTWVEERCRLSRNFFWRAEIYEETGLRNKWARLSQLMKAQGYQSRIKGGLGWKSLIKDLAHLTGRSP